MTDKEMKIKDALQSKKNYSDSFAFHSNDIHRVFDMDRPTKVALGVDNDIQLLCLAAVGIRAYGDPIRINADGTYSVVLIRHCSQYQQVKINNKLRHVIICTRFDASPTDITYAYTIDELPEVCKVCNAFELQYPYMI